MKRVLVLSIALLLTNASLAQAVAVYPGCAVPANLPGHKTFFVDPKSGNMNGDGSAAKPWHTLAEVFDPKYKLISTQQHGRGFVSGADTSLYLVNPTAPIHGGDVILLKSGDHGSPWLEAAFNTDFITVAAAPGETPLVHFTSIKSASKWIFQGLKFQDQFPVGGSLQLNGLVRIGYAEWQGSTSDIIMNGNSFSATDDTSGWSDKDWQNKPFGTMLYARAPCISFTSNHIYNANNGVLMQADNGLFKGNTVDHFYTDGFDMVGSNLTVQGNIIRDNVSTKNLIMHPDAVQGWTVGGLTNKNYVVDSNYIVRYADKVGGWMDGITIFDGKWDGVTITNNVIATNAWHGINLAGPANAKVMNNTLIATDVNPIWINITPDKSATPAANPIVKNNIAPQILVHGTNVTADHNIAAVAMSFPDTNGYTVYNGTTKNKNAVVPMIMNQFVNVDRIANQYDARLKPTSAAIGFGDAAGAPTADITGAKRAVPNDNGAYTHNQTSLGVAPNLKNATAAGFTTPQVQ